MSFPPPELKSLAEQVVSLLIQRKETVSLVETATGGLVAATLLSLPGTSAIFQGGVNAYSLPSRQAFLEWKESDTASYDGPTEAIVLSLARSLRRSLSSTWSLAESGVAGPSLPSKYRAEILEVGVGYCPIAVVGEGVERSKTVVVKQPRERGENMVQFAVEVLRAFLEVLTEQKGSKDVEKL
ncbi:hypothetical protein BCR35DRAFT_307019 [Leucosporidium creatinivorum]|uniref:CinA C-terminal domain-containing protein n=1 Tax=Leucosporidium creatinivorum TaxID=106004 RepID=A0A1Y2EPW4_9BASI|nr:hypothetical protein BCR35DRAFT_307019 [Leucosporidium creatinivorum]